MDLVYSIFILNEEVE